MIKIEAPEAYELVGLRLAQDARQQFPDRAMGQRGCIIFTTTVGGLKHVWAVWRIKSGWVARWLRYEGDE
jgi:hypothetical protein